MFENWFKGKNFYNKNNLESGFFVCMELNNNYWYGIYAMALTYDPVREKTNNLGSEQIQHKPGCTVTDDS